MMKKHERNYVTHLVASSPSLDESSLESWCHLWGSVSGWLSSPSEGQSAEFWVINSLAMWGVSAWVTMVDPVDSWTRAERFSFYGPRQHTPSIEFTLTWSILAALYQKQTPPICYSCQWWLCVSKVHVICGASQSHPRFVERIRRVS